MRSLLLALITLPIVLITPYAEAKKPVRTEKCGKGVCIPDSLTFKGYSKEKQEKVCKRYGFKHHSTGSWSTKPNYCYREKNYR